ncbi:MAG: PAS domain S-box protein [Chloroflexi bacterium]|uniref:PAS domain S-box protein n=1 Tax=Candidatus Chlorohelix allophototropha TaxID=3003348 RepID=A0A8T7M8Q6_9CHLR|nr:PAS domain S-box protein [Chloroflexota bacterium]WJW68316.1 PAS domain S-box protein [Chloroflexota bacterium L227-S17]
MSDQLKTLLEEVESLREQLAEARETLDAIRRHEVDALVMEDPNGTYEIFTIKGADFPYRLFVEQMSQGAVTLNLSGIILYCNQRFAELMELPIEQIIGSYLQQFVAIEDKPFLEGALEKGSIANFRYEMNLSTVTGKQAPFDLAFSPMQVDVLPVICLVATDLTAQKQAESQIRANLVEKETLLKELHHRVKNNLQVVYSLLKLQAANIKDPEIADLFIETQNRVQSMALVHQKLYQAESFSRVDMENYIQSLITNLHHSLSFDPKKVFLDVKIEGVLLNMDTAIPCGLIINELLYNAFKHAFPDNRNGIVKIELSRDATAMFCLRISDDGVGLPENLDPHNTETLGMQLVAMLTRQLDGTLELLKEHGTTFIIKFRELRYRERV